MKTILRKLTWCLILGSLVEASADQVVFQTVNQFGHTRYRSLVMEGDLINTPKWQEHEDFPPLSPRRAEAKARAELRTTLPAIREWRLVEFSLQRVGSSDNWIYIVEMKPSLQKETVNGQVDSIEIVVLMNERAIKPKEEKNKPRVWQMK